MPADTDETILTECKFDFCHLQSDETVCTALSTFAQQCFDEHEIAVKYRSANLCRKYIRIYLHVSNSAVSTYIYIERELVYIYI